MGIVKTRKLSVRPKIILFSKTVQDYGNRSADICLVMQAVGQVGYYLSMCTPSLGHGCSAAVEHSPRDSEVVGSIPRISPLGKLGSLYT